MKLNWNKWSYAVLYASIQGAATAGYTWMGLVGAQAIGIDVPVMNLKSLGVVLASGALSNFFSVLKQSPLPKDEDSQ